MKKIIAPIILIIVFIVSAILLFVPRNNKKEISNNIWNTIDDKVENNEITNNTITENKVDESMNTIYIKVNNNVLSVKLEDNSATRELKEQLKNKDIIVNAHEYGGFEKVGNLGFSLPKKDANITTSAGDIVLYQGNQISVFYNSNSWSYTKLGKVQNISSNELKDILSNGDVTIIFTLSR